ncbi:hypothetical protein MRB53_010999 [Persea americana]|uniref:Uncharacterized protein n=1 Tax=Persea americana TaxID=3435 RepID=A0ACC2LTE5_PERAE|nr:hypothetical protein MRB53_010999 [Persea americana]
MPVTSSFYDATGLCLRFSCEMLRNSIPCLITITIEGKCSEPLNVVVKVNCEETRDEGRRLRCAPKPNTTSMEIIVAALAGDAAGEAIELPGKNADSTFLMRF